MVLDARPLDVAFPSLNDLVAVRRHFQQRIRSRAGALVSCDVVSVSGLNVVRSVSKYRTEHQYAMAFTASLTVPLADWEVELLIWGREDGFTGIREAIVTSELLRTAGPSAQRQINEKKIPIELKFERYEPDTQPDLCFVASDDDQYDPQFPDHPLTRVRRWLRRQERAFSVTRDEESAALKTGANPHAQTGVLGSVLKKFGALRGNGGLPAAPASNPVSFEIRYLPATAMSHPELIHELGAQVTADYFAPEVLRRLNPPLPEPPLATRQKMYRDQREASAKARMEQHQQRAAELKQVREETEKLAQDLRAPDTLIYLARERSSGHWLTISEGNQAGVLAVFTSAAAADDFLLCKSLDCEPVPKSVNELVASLPSLGGQGIAALEFDRCPRCAEVRPVVQLLAIPGEGEILKQYAARVITKRFFVDKNVRIARNEKDVGKRLVMLNYTVQHIDAGAPAVYIEIGKCARESGNSALLEHVKHILAKYSPDSLASLDPSPGGTST